MVGLLSGKGFIFPAMVPVDVRERCKRRIVGVEVLSGV